MPSRQRNAPPKFHVEVNLRNKESPQPWKWEIYAAGQSLFIEQSESGYARRADAVDAGNLAIERLLESLRTP